MMNEKINCIIVDDEPLALDLMESYIRKTPFLNLAGRYDNSVEAMAAIRELQPDLLFLDIQMPELNGIELARFVPEQCIVIFVTAFEQYAVEGFRVNAADYLLKPVSYAEFMNAADKARKLFDLRRRAAGAETQTLSLAEDKNAGKESFFVKTDYKLQQVCFRDILYIEGLKDYVKIYLEAEPRPLVSRLSMKAVEALLPAADFIRVHRSFIVRKEKIRVIERNRIVFGKEHIPVSDSYKDSFNEFLSHNMAE